MHKIIELIKSKKIRQVFSLYSTTILGMILGVGISIINTKYLGPESYGDLKFLIHMFSFIVMFLTLGFFFSGSRLLAASDHKDHTGGIKGAMLLYGVFISLLMITVFFIFSFFQDKIYQNDLGHVIRLFSPFLFVFPMKLCLEGIMIGSNQIYKLSVYRIFPKIFYIVGAVTVNLLFDLTLHWALLIEFLGLALIGITMIILLKPQFNRVKTHWTAIRKENKSYGFPVYISHLANTATMRIAALSIAFFIDNTNVGFYALAITITQPMSMIPRVVGTTLFKDFANKDRIPPKATTATLGLSLMALACFFLLIKTLFFLIYPTEFEPALRIVYYFAAGSLVHGFADYVNRFLGAHGRGVEMRNSAFLVALCNIIGYTVLVKFFSLEGAIITRVTASCIYLTTMVYFYKKIVRKNAQNVQQNF